MDSQSFKILYAISPREFKQMDTQEIRENFLLDPIFDSDRINLVYTHYDRLIVGGANPTTMALSLRSIAPLKADYFLERRELGIINVGGTGTVVVDEVEYELKNKEALYIGRGSKSVDFLPGNSNDKPLFYFNSAPAHASYPTKKIGQADAEIVEIGTLEQSNHRLIRKLIVSPVVETCQLQMGMTELKTGSVWNTMPSHTHDRRMEAYFYFELPEPNQRVCHFLGEPDQTRHIWMSNHQAVLSPPWSIHSGAGTSNYSFIWGMAGENMDYGDMDPVKPTELK